MRVFKDQMDFFVTVPDKPKRIVSLVPSQTELLCDLGLENEIVGITKFCIHPDSVYRSKVRIGGTKTPDIEAIKLLAPDLIIANKEENEEEMLLALKKLFPTWISDVRNLGQAQEMIGHLGEIFHQQENAGKIATKIRHNFERVHTLSRKVKVAYFIWRKPYMTVNRNTFIHDMLTRCGMVNVFADSTDRYPKVTEEELRKKKPEILLLSSEPYPFAEKHFEELKELFPEARIFLVDGEMFSWYGSRLIKAPGYFNKLIARIEKRPKPIQQDAE